MNLIVNVLLIKEVENWCVSYDLVLKPFSYVQTEGFSIIELFCPLTGGAYNINHVTVII